MENFKIFGIGWCKTGTTTLEATVKDLGFSRIKGSWRTANVLVPYWQSGEYEKIFDIIEHYDVCADMPFCLLDFYKILDKQYPSAKFILTVRNSESWFRSFKRHCLDVHYDENFSKYLIKTFDTGFSGFYIGYEKTYGKKSIFSDKEYFKKIFETRNKEVIDYFAGTDKLLVVDWESGSGWRDLCKFLGKKVV